MTKFSDIEKKLQNFQGGSEFNVRYENNGKKRVYIIYPGKALELFRQTIANSQWPLFLRRPNIESNSIVEYRVEECNGVIISQGFTAKSPVFGRENLNTRRLDLWNSSIFGTDRRTNNQEALEFGQPNNQGFSVIKPQSQMHRQDTGICQCKSTVKKTLLDDWNRCRKCGGMFNDEGTEEAERRQKANLDNLKREREEDFRISRENEKINEERFNRLISDGSSTSFSYQQNSCSESQSRFVEINEDQKENELLSNFQRQQFISSHKQDSSGISSINFHEVEVPKFNQNKSSKIFLIVVLGLTLFGLVSLMTYFFKKKNEIKK